MTTVTKIYNHIASFQEKHSSDDKSKQKGTEQNSTKKTPPLAGANTPAHIGSEGKQKTTVVNGEQSSAEKAKASQDKPDSKTASKGASKDSKTDKSDKSENQCSSSEKSELKELVRLDLKEKTNLKLEKSDKEIARLELKEKTKIDKSEKTDREKDVENSGSDSRAEGNDRSKGAESKAESRGDKGDNRGIRSEADEGRASRENMMSIPPINPSGHMHTLNNTPTIPSITR